MIIIYWALFGPVLLLYCKSVIDKNFKLKRKHLIHLILLIISVLSVLKYLQNRSNYNTFIEYYNLQTGVTKFGLLVWEFTSAIYIFFVLIILFNHKKRIKNYFSNLDKKELNWLLFLTLGFAVYIYSSYVYWILKDVFNIHLGFRFIDMLGLFLTVYVFGLGIFGYKQDGIFFDSELLTINNGVTKPNNSKYQKTGLTLEEEESLNIKLVEFMQKEKPFLESEITIKDLALQVGTSVHKLSQVINEKHKRNFFDFINFYRINEVKKILVDSTIEDSKIELIAYDCGFSSKSAFYSIFKKHTLQTPTEFRQKQKVAV